MADLSSLGISSVSRPASAGTQSQLVILQRPLDRVLAFTRHNIHEVVNDPIAQREVLGYFKLQRWVTRELERGDLERQWNPLG